VFASTTSRHFSGAGFCHSWVNAGVKAARRRGRVGGRPKALDEADLKKRAPGDKNLAIVLVDLGYPLGLTPNTHDNGLYHAY
jgi:hypothetical protein